MATSHFVKSLASFSSLHEDQALYGEGYNGALALFSSASLGLGWLAFRTRDC